MFLYCIPLMVNSFSFLFLGTYNKNIVLYQLGETASGYYAFVLKFTSILSILISIFSLAWQEVAFQNANSAERDKMYSYYINTFMKFIGLGIPLYCLLLYYFAPIVGGTEYILATQYIPLAVFGTFISEVSGVLGVVIAVSKRTFPILFSTIVGAIVNVSLVTWMTKAVGINAASIGLCLGFFCVAVYRYFVGKKLIVIKMNIKYVALIFIEMLVTTGYFYLGNIVLFIALILSLSITWWFVNIQEIKLVLHLVKNVCFR